MKPIDPRIRHIVDAVAERYGTTPVVVMGRIENALSWNSARALAKAVREAYPDLSLLELAEILERKRKTVADFIEDGSPDRPGRKYRHRRWSEAQTARLKQLVNSGAHGKVICAELGFEYPRQRRVIYNEVRRLLNNGLITPGDLRCPRAEVDSAGP